MVTHACEARASQALQYLNEVVHFEPADCLPHEHNRQIPVAFMTTSTGHCREKGN